MRRAAVIGSGISGLTAALLLSRRGFAVSVFEKQREAGGALHRFRRGSIPFDVGFHYTGGLGHGEILRALWRHCGIDGKITILPFPEQGSDCVRVEGFPEPIHAYFSYERITDELLRFFPREKKGILQFFQTIRDVAASIPFYNMEVPLAGFLQSLAFPEQSSLADLITSCTANPALQTVLSLPVLLHGVRPGNIGLTMHTSVAHLMYQGMYTVDRGGQAIADALLQVLREAGVTVHTSAPVEHILTENGRVTGIRTSTGDFDADDVVFTPHPSLLPDMVSSAGLRKVYRNRLRDLENTLSMFIVFGAIEEAKHNERLRWTNYYSLPASLKIPTPCDRPEQCFFLSGCGYRDTEGAGKNGKDRAVIIMRPANWEEAEPFDRGPRKRAGAYSRWKKSEADRLVSAVQANWDGLLNGFRVINTASPLTFRDELSYVRGAVYGRQHTMNQFGVGARTKVSGLWLSGQSTLMTGVLGASLSALVTVGSMTGDLETLWREVRECV